MPLVNLARDQIMDAIIGGTTYNKFSATNAHLGVGDSTAVFAATQTDLQAATNKAREIVDGAPTRSANQVTWVATFETTDANFAWQEVGLFNAVSGGEMFSRLVQSLGTKTSSGTWQLSYAITLTLA